MKACDTLVRVLVQRTRWPCWSWTTVHSFSDAALDHLTSCDVLQRVEVYDCQLITRAGIRRLKVDMAYVISGCY